MCSGNIKRMFIFVELILRFVTRKKIYYFLRSNSYSRISTILKIKYYLVIINADDIDDLL